MDAKVFGIVEILNKLDALEKLVIHQKTQLTLLTVSNAHYRFCPKESWTEMAGAKYCRTCGATKTYLEELPKC